MLDAFKYPELDVMFAALQTPLGVVCKVADSEKALARFYRVRQECDNPILSSLAFRKSREKPDTEIWIVKTPKGAQNDSSQTTG